jgi:uncharacterized membrane protein YedE/YeeE
VKALLSATVSGLLFALGLGIGGMTIPAKVIGFLDFTGNWDPSLAFVMAGAVSIYAALRPVILKRHRRLSSQRVPSKQLPVDRRLVLGSAIFGIGWGSGGYCPGPALVSIVTLNRSVLLFLGAMAAGMVLHSAGRLHCRRT